MTTYPNRTVAALALCLASSQASFGLGFRLTDYDAFSFTRGSAFLATADRPSAIYFNPAGITQLSGHQVQLGGYAVTYHSSYRSPGGARADSRQAFEALPQFYYAYRPERGPLAFGVGLYSPFGLSMKWPETTGFRSVALDGRVEYLTLQPVIAWQVHPTLSLAAGPMFNYAKTDLRQGLTATAGNDYFRFKGDDTDVGYTAALRWQPLAEHAFGLTYRSATTLNYHGRTETVSLTPAFAAHAGGERAVSFPADVGRGLVVATRAGVESRVQCELDGLERAQNGAHRANHARAAAGA